MNGKISALLLVLIILSGLVGPGSYAEATAPGASAPEAVDPGDDGQDTAEEAPLPARGYVLVSTAAQSGWLPLPEEGEYSYHLKQVLADGSEAENVIHLTPDGVYMEDSTCENHDCVGQGIVTLENRDERILGNFIICLPNQVYLQLFTPEEILEMMKSEP